MRFFARSIAVASILAFAGIASAHEVVYAVNLDGPSEAPPNASPGTGFATITFDLDLVTMRVETSFSGLLGNVTASHIHGPTTDPFTGTASVATALPSFPDFPLGGTSGVYDHTFDMTLASSYNPAFITASGGTISGALTRLLAAAAEGKAYLNIHTSAFAPGEIRGFLTPVPAPSAAALLGLGGLAATRRRRA